MTIFLMIFGLVLLIYVICLFYHIFFDYDQDGKLILRKWCIACRCNKR